MMRSRKRSKETGTSSPCTSSPQASICCRGHALAGQELLERVAAVGGEAQPERLLRRRRQPAVAKIGARPGAVGALQLLLEETGVAISMMSVRLARCFSRLRGFASRAGNGRPAIAAIRSTASGKSCRRARSGSGNDRRTRRSQSNDSDPSGPRSESSGFSRHGTDSRPNSRRAARWSSCGPTTRARR